MRYARQSKIVELVNQYQIETQETLAEYLKQAGFKVTQATVSRDIKEMQLIKAPGPNGKNIYTLPTVPEAPETMKFKRVLKETVLSVTPAENIIVIKTLNGCANAAAEAMDNAHSPEILGTIAGDNTIIMVIDKKENVPKIIDLLNEALK